MAWWAAGEERQLVLKLLLLAPLIEEVFFRAVVHASLLRRFAHWRSTHFSAANLATAILFGALHLVYAPAPHAIAVVLPALAIGWVFERWRSVVACVALHAAFNGIWLLIRGGL